MSREGVSAGAATPTEGVSGESERHHPTVCSTGRYGCWSYCSCGWQSPTLRRRAGASLAWANHIVEVSVS